MSEEEDSDWFALDCMNSPAKSSSSPSELLVSDPEDPDDEVSSLSDSLSDEEVCSESTAIS